MTEETLQKSMTAEQAVELLRSWAEEQLTVGLVFCGGDNASGLVLQGQVADVEPHLFSVHFDSGVFSLSLHPATFSFGPLHIVDPTRGLVTVAEGLHIGADSGSWAFLAPSYVPRPEHVQLLQQH